VKIRTIAVLVAIAVLISCKTVSSTLYNNNVSSAQKSPKSEKSPSKPAEIAVKLNSDKSEQPGGALSPKWQHGIIDTTAGADYLTGNERDVIIEINMVRTDPAAYARHYLEPLKSFYRGSLFQYPGEIAISTSEGVRALEECVKVLKSSRPSSSVSPKKGLTLAARDHAKDQARTGATGHAGSDGSTITARINRYGKWNISVGENIDYGNSEARRIITALLIDDGIPSRGHRKNLLEAGYSFVGVAVGPHKIYEKMCVIDFAGSYE